ncbi:hypothetical protein AEQU_1875 [Adlercreutzia equolifaciens DSM 19450]|nr:hypothetical protein AEQU_1875 [Adlercreutzia equolifaciens DSM 19450]
MRRLQALAAASQLANDRAQMFGARLANFQTIVRETALAGQILLECFR